MNLYLDARPIRCPRCSGGTYALGTAMQQLAQASGRLAPVAATHCLGCRRLLVECNCPTVRPGDEPSIGAAVWAP